MNTRDDIVATLGQLSQVDRAWILDRLSPGARAALVNGGANVPKVVELPPAAAVPATPELDPAAVVAILADEPAWVTHALFSLQRSWGDSVRERLPTTLRGEIERLGSYTNRYSSPLVATLENALTRAVKELGPSVPLMSQPETWWEKLGSRVARRRTRMPA